MPDLRQRVTTVLLGVLLICILPVAAQAEETGGKGHGPGSFSVFDMDENGFVSEEEFYSVRQQRMAAKAAEGKKMRCAASAPAFADLDTDGDGQLNPDELAAGQKAHRAKCQEGHGEGHGQGQGKGHGKGHGKGYGKGDGTGHGQGQGMKGNMPTFSDFDLDGDGVIGESEFNEAHAKKMSEMAAQGHKMKHAGDAPGFSGIDTNDDGAISAQEFSDHQAAHHLKMQNQQDKQN